MRVLGSVLAVFAIFLAGCGTAGREELAPRDDFRPNIVLIITDDQGYGDLGAHGNEVIRTPHLDKLHSESLRFTDFHVDPTCAPTRAALMTGRYSSRTGVWHTIIGRSLAHRDERLLPELLAESGYATGHFGKWHLGDNYPYRPEERGFQQAVRHGGGGVTQTPDWWGNDYFDDTYWRNGEPVKFEGYCTDVFFREALKFIESNRNRPFFAYITTNAPHSPFLVDAKYSQPYEEQGVPHPMSKFYGMIENIDENVGALRAKLAEWDLEDNTILIFMSDNGTAAGVAPDGGAFQGVEWGGFNDGMRGRKGSEYDGGHRVPFFIRWPEAGWGQPRDIGTLAAHIDVLPTLLELSGVPIPAHLDLDGRSLVPLLRDEGVWPGRMLLVHSQRIDIPEKWRKSAVMTDRWRLINGEELYDIRADPGQQHDLSGDNPSAVAQLREAYENWWEHISGRFDDHVHIVVGADQENPARLTAHDWRPEEGEMVPWNQQMIQSNPPMNGHWMIEVAREGTYEFELLNQDRPADHPLGATSVRVKAGDAAVSAPADPRARSATVRLELPAGKMQLQTWLDSTDGVRRGAFFAYVRRL